MFPGFEWAVLKLGVCGTVHSIEVDTIHFKGNFPESICIEALPVAAAGTEDVCEVEMTKYLGKTSWKVLLPRVKLGAHKQHYFHLDKGEIEAIGSISHIRATIFPDGGVSRIRLNGLRDVPAK